MPATLTEDPLGLACVFGDATTATFALRDLPCPDLVRDLLVGLVELIHPHGAVDAAGSVNHYVLAIRNMVRALAERGFTGGAAQLRRARLAEYWMATTASREACTRRMLQAYDTTTGGLAEGVREFVAGRRYNPQKRYHPLLPYREDEWARLANACRLIVDEAFTAHKNALAAAAGGQHPGTGGWTQQNLTWLVARTGPVSTAEFARHAGCSDRTTRRRGGFYEASTRLFPHLDAVIAYRLLFGVYSGIVPDGIDDLVVDDIDWAGDASILLSYVKGRTTAESLTLPRRAVRLLEQWLSHSSLLRSFTDPQTSRHLWMGVSQVGNAAVFTGPPHPEAIQRWVGRHRVTGDDGGPLRIHRSRVRTTHHSMRDTSAWAGRGRATIDPNHSPQVEGDHYLTATTPAQQQAVDAIVEDAQHDLLRRAQPPTVMSEEDTVGLVRDYPQLVGAMRLDDAAVAELVGGRRDVFVAGCADQLAGLHGPKGQPCPARPWVCLLCPLAVFAPRHAGNLLRLNAFFTRQWRQMPTTQFMAVFGPYAQRIRQVLDRFDPAVLAAAAGQVADSDDELPLRPEEMTQ
jgi:hypothetical protein